MPLDIDLDLLADLVNESLPWFEAWAAILSLTLGLVILAAAREAARLRNDPVARIMRRRRS